MRAILFCLSFLTLSYFNAQKPLSNLTDLVNNKCLGSPSDPLKEEQKVTLRLLGPDSLSIDAVTTTIGDGKTVRRNKYELAIADIDADSLVVKQFGEKFGLFIYTKGAEKKFKQSAWLQGDGTPLSFYQERLCISEFEERQTVEELKGYFIELVSEQRKK